MRTALGGLLLFLATTAMMVILVTLAFVGAAILVAGMILRVLVESGNL